MKSYDQLSKAQQRKYRVTMRKKLFTLWSKSVRERDKECYFCQSTVNLQAHHFFCRSFYKALRYDKRNGVTLCASCHRFKGMTEYGSMHHSPLATYKWIEDNKETYEYLLQYLNKDVDYDDIEILNNIKEVLNE